MDQILGKHPIFKVTATDLVCCQKWYSPELLTHIAGLVIIIIGWIKGYMTIKSTLSIVLCMLMIHCLVVNQCQENGSLINLLVLACLVCTFCVFSNMSYTMISGKQLQIPYMQ